MLPFSPNSCTEFFSRRNAGYANLLQVLLAYQSHEDQQVRGLLRVTIGHLIVSALIEEDYVLKNSEALMNEELLGDLTRLLLKVSEEIFGKREYTFRVSAI